jgi:hypothetical protein
VIRPVRNAQSADVSVSPWRKESRATSAEEGVLKVEAVMTESGGGGGLVGQAATKRYDELKSQGTGRKVSAR